MKNNDNLQIWSNFFNEIDRENELKRLKALSEAYRRQITLRSRTDNTLMTTRSSSTDWTLRLQALHAKHHASTDVLDTFMLEGLTQRSSQHSLQNCLTQALCILDEVKHTPSIHSIDSQFGDFHTLLGLLEEANSHLHALLTE